MSFTWFRGDCSSMSRLDIFLLSKEWCVRWPHMIQQALIRGLSYHFPILLLIDEENWVPRLHRMLKDWADLPCYHQFVKDQWQMFQVSGWGGCVLKEKLKLTKGSLYARESHSKP